MEIKFNQSIYNDFDVSWVNYTNTNISLIPAMNRDEFAGFNWTTLNFTWKTLNITENKLFIKINFSEPIETSPLIEQDTIKVFFNQSASFFRSIKYNVTLHEKY